GLSGLVGGRRRGAQRAAVARAPVHGAAGVVVRERVRVGRDGEARREAVRVDVAEQAGLAACAGRGGGAAHHEAQLGREDLRGARAAGGGELGVAVLAFAPLVAVLVALRAVPAV